MFFFNMWYAPFYYILAFLLHCYKSFFFHYSYAAFEWELVMLALMAFIDGTRLILGSRGNKTEQIPPLAWSIALSIPMALGFSFFLTIQTYVLRLDVVTNTIALVFLGLSFFFSLFTMISFYRGFTG